VYDEAKRFAEAMTMAYHRSTLDNAHRRIFNSTARACGPPPPPPGKKCKRGPASVSNFIVQALRGEPLTRLR